MSDEKLSYLIDQYGNTILRLAYSYLKNQHDAEDVCQSVFVKLYTLEKAFEDASHEKAFLLHITANLCKDMLKSAWKKKNVGSVDLELLGESAQKTKVSFIEEDEVLELVNGLGEKYRTVLYLYYYEGYQIKEVAKILGIKTPTVKTRLKRGKEQLKEILEEIV